MNVYTYNLRLDHPLITEGRVKPLVDISFDPWNGQFENQCRAAVGAEAVRFSWVNVDLFDVDRLDSEGTPIGTTRDAFLALASKKSGFSPRDTPKFKVFADMCSVAGKWPKVIQFAGEHDYKDLIPTAQYDQLRATIIKNALDKCGLYDRCEHIAVDWLNFTGRPNPYAVDWNWYPLTFIKNRVKFRSNAQHYRALEPVQSQVLARFKLYLTQCSPGSMPWIDACEWGTTSKMLKMCEDAQCPGVFVFFWGDDSEVGQKCFPQYQSQQLSAALAAWSE